MFLQRRRTKERAVRWTVENTNTVVSSWDDPLVGPKKCDALAAAFDATMKYST